MSLIQKMIKNKGLSEEDTKALITQLLEFVHIVKCMRKAQDAAERAYAECDDSSLILNYVRKAEELQDEVDMFIRSLER